jgi:hypothetical protein
MIRAVSVIFKAIPLAMAAEIWHSLAQALRHLIAIRNLFRR